MASSVTIDVDSEKKDEFDFQDIPHDDKWAPVSQTPESKPPGKTHTFTNFPHSAADSDNEEDDDEKTEFLKEKKNASFWTFEYYQQFFDVETTQVGSRILGSMVPRPNANYLDSHIRPNPDLYGPFWICTTLVFTTAIAGNLANYFQAAGQNYHWVYDFHKVTFAATAIFSYWWLIPFILFGLLWWRGNPARYTFLELICVYGYSLAIYIPISLLWVIPVGWLQWLLVVVGALLSGSALLLTVWPAIKEDKKQVALGVMGVIFLLHAALAMGFMLYFFHVPSRAASPTPANNATTPSLTPTPHLNNVPGNLNLHQQEPARVPKLPTAAAAAAAQPHNLLNAQLGANPAQADGIPQGARETKQPGLPQNALPQGSPVDVKDGDSQNNAAPGGNVLQEAGLGQLDGDNPQDGESVKGGADGKRAEGGLLNKLGGA